MRVVWTFSFNFRQEKTNKVIFLASSISLSPFAILPHCFLHSLPDCSLLFSPVCVLTLRYPCELLLYQVWEWALPGSKASEHLQRWMLLFSDARSRLGRPLWNLPQQGRGCVHTRHMHGNTHVFASSLIELCVILWYSLHSHFMIPEAYPLLCPNTGYQQGEDDNPKGLWVINTIITPVLQRCRSCGIRYSLMLMFFYSQILMNALMTLASMASASTQTALSDVNAPWDTVWTSVESDVKVSLSSSSSFSLFCHTLSQFIHLGPHYRKV